MRPVTSVPVAQPLVVDPEAARPPDTRIHHNAADVRSVLEHVQVGKCERAKCRGTHASRTHCGDVGFGNVLVAERVVQHEYSHPGLRALDQDVAQRIRDAPRNSVVHLHRDRALRGAEIVPQSRKRAVAIERDLDSIAARQQCAGEHGDTQRELRIFGRHGNSVRADAAHVFHRGAASDVEKTDHRDQ
jgi:hypothetical protein